MKDIGQQISYDKPSKDELVVEIKPVLGGQKMNLLLLWGAAWTVCGLIILISLFTYGFKKEEYLMVGIFLIFWTYFEVKVFHAIRWNKWGLEKLQIKDGEFLYHQTINGRGFPKVDEISKMNSFRFAVDSQKGLWSDINNSSWMVGGEVIEYTCDGAVKRIGMKLSQKDAEKLIVLLNKTAGLNA